MPQEESLLEFLSGPQYLQFVGRVHGLDVRARGGQPGGGEGAGVLLAGGQAQAGQDLVHALHYRTASSLRLGAPGRSAAPRSRVAFFLTFARRLMAPTIYSPAS